MTEVWKQWEDQVLDGQFQLHQYLGGCENSAVFLAESRGEPQKVAIKLIPVVPENTEIQLRRFERARNLSHPHLIRILQAARYRVSNRHLIYVVMEYAEENLAQVLPERSLTPVEVREMLEPILNALAYVHGQGFVHGHIKPANILSVQDQLKISVDRIYRMEEFRNGPRKPGSYDAPEIVRGEISPAADVWSLGITLVEALTQRLPVWEGSRQRELVLPETLPVQFRELARHCLRTDVQSRWRVGDIVAHMQQWSSAPQSRIAASPGARFSNWRYVAPMVALGLLLTAMLVGPRLFKDQSNAQRNTSTVAETTGRPEEALKPVAPKAGQVTQGTGGEKPSALNAVPQHLPAQPGAGSPTANVDLVPGEVVQQVLPDVPRRARHTIKGKVRVGIRVRVDPLGRLLGAEVDSPGPSRYFAGLAMKAARRWKFSPAKVDGRNVPSEWILRFQFGRTATSVVPVRTAP